MTTAAVAAATHRPRGANWNGPKEAMTEYLETVFKDAGVLTYSPSFEDPTDPDEMTLLLPYIILARKELQDDLLIRFPRCTHTTGTPPAHRAQKRTDTHKHEEPFI